ncbi:LANO_0H09912g1_1 [Lachancea nothofagi CBS 11611]|uniref:LANO_0H09912g1_1 n=1 Tax=Lachancea nothofagi CBS 11611 TaxID=1266666 RepID=A0A1G4KM89_9SACH|nr:LANO_0H09912g1_1 [Lachancea nothofagi CBS 11611]
MAKGTPVKKNNGSKRGTPVSTPPVKTKKAPSKNATPVSTPASTPSKKKKKAVKQTEKQGEKLVMKSKAAPVAKEPETVIPKDRIVRAVQELSKFTDSEKEKNGGSNQLLEDEDELDKQVELIAVNTTSFSSNKKAFKPKQFKIEHSLFKPWKQASETSVKDFKLLLILKDQDAAKCTEDQLYDQLHESGITVDAVITGNDLKTKYKAFEKRRAFVQDFSLILADDSVVTALPKILGGKAYEKVSTTPVPIKTNKNGAFSLTTLVNSIKKVYLNALPVKMPRGTTLNAHLGNLEWFSVEELATNVLMVVEQLVKDSQVRSIFLKVNKSPVLPLYYNQNVLDELVKQKEDKSKGSSLQKVTIDGTELEISHFDAGLLEIANPDELNKVFASRINKAKKRTAEETEPVVPAKKAKA